MMCYKVKISGAEVVDKQHYIRENIINMQIAMPLKINSIKLGNTTSGMQLGVCIEGNKWCEENKFFFLKLLFKINNV